MEKNVLKQILLAQEDEIRKIKDKIICRDKELSFQKALNDPLVKVILGTRRCGKSFLGHHLLKDKFYGYIDFDDERFGNLKTEDLNSLLEMIHEIKPNFEILFLDEVQNVDRWELFVSRLQRQGYNILLTGSNAKLLSKELATHLTGRHLSLELFPLSFREFLKFEEFIWEEKDFYLPERKAKIKNLFQEYLQQGGFPELFKVTFKERYLQELYNKIISRDILSRFNIRYIKDFKEISFYALSNFSSRISYNKIKNMFLIKSVHTVKNYLSYLEEAYLIFQLSPFSFKVKHQLMQPKKVYAIDSGLINALVPMNSSNIGRHYENIVFLELLRTGKEIYFYYDPGREWEVDFLLRVGQRVTELIQVCYEIGNNETKEREIKSLIKGLEEFKLKEGLVITDDYEGEESIKNKRIKFIPLWKWLLTVCA